MAHHMRDEMTDKEQEAFDMKMYENSRKLDDQLREKEKLASTKLRGDGIISQQQMAEAAGLYVHTEKDVMPQQIATEVGKLIDKELMDKELNQEGATFVNCIAQNFGKDPEGSAHYKKMAVEPVDYIAANDLNFFEGNVIKYVSRHRDAGGVKDIEKAIHYCKMILKYEYKIIKK